MLPCHQQQEIKPHKSNFVEPGRNQVTCYSQDESQDTPSRHKFFHHTMENRDLLINTPYFAAKTSFHMTTLSISCRHLTSCTPNPFILWFTNTKPPSMHFSSSNNPVIYDKKYLGDFEIW